MRSECKNQSNRILLCFLNLIQRTTDWTTMTMTTTTPLIRQQQPHNTISRYLPIFITFQRRRPFDIGRTKRGQLGRWQKSFLCLWMESRVGILQHFLNFHFFQNAAKILIWRQVHCEKNGPILAYFCLFSSFSQISISIIQIEKSVDSVLGIRTQGRRIVGAGKTTELVRPQNLQIFKTHSDGCQICCKSACGCIRHVRYCKK